MLSIREVTRAVNGILLSRPELRGHSSARSVIYSYVLYETRLFGTERKPHNTLFAGKSH